jgi:transposase
MVTLKENYNSFFGSMVSNPFEGDDPDALITVRQGVFVPNDPPGVYVTENMAHYRGILLSVHFYTDEWTALEGTAVRAALKSEYEKLHKTVLAIVREDAVCRRLMTAPSVGPLVAITYKSTMDDPNRIAKSKAAGALFGLTPKKYQSGEKDVTGGITRAGDEMVRTALYEAANVLLSRITRFSKLKRWGMDVAKRRGPKRAKVALARKIAVILHRMWVDGTTYQWTAAEQIAAQA